MCGICGVIPGRKIEDEEKELFFSLILINERRGRDATGVYYCGEDSERLVKLPVKASVFMELKEILKKDMQGSVMLLGHTRAATRGNPSVNINNHPWKIDKWVFAHNGVAYDYGEFGWMKYSPVSELPRFADSRIVTDSYRNLFVPIVERLYPKREVREEDVKNAIEEVVNEKCIIGAFWLADTSARKVYIVNIDGEMTYELGEQFLFSSIELRKKLDEGEMIVCSCDGDLEIERMKLNVVRRRLNRGSVRRKEKCETWGWHEWEAY